MLHNRRDNIVQCYFLDFFQLPSIQLLCITSRLNCVGFNRTSSQACTVECRRQYCSLADRLVRGSHCIFLTGLLATQTLHVLHIFRHICQHLHAATLIENKSYVHMYHFLGDPE